MPEQEAAWWGKDFILSGSDCGHLFAWDRKSGECVTMLEADRCSLQNCKIFEISLNEDVKK